MDLIYPRPSAWKTRVISTICLLGMAASLFLLRADIQSPGFLTRSRPMAVIQESGDNARRRTSKSYLWLPAKSGDTLYLHDSLRTGPDGEASIRLKDGSTLEVGEDSLIVIDEQKDLSLDFVRGSFIVRSTAGDKQISITSGGKKELRALPVRAIAPAPSGRFFTIPAREAQVKFEWTSKGHPIEHARLELSRSRNFARERTRTEPVAKDPSGRVTIGVAPGDWYWRLVSSNAKGNEPLTETRALHVETVFPLRPIAPDPATTAVLWGEEGVLSFRWAPLLSSRGEHELEVAREASFKSALFRVPVDAVSGTASVKGVPEGKLFWRLVSRYDTIAVESAAVPFTVKWEKQLPVALLSPRANAALENRPKLRLSWRFEGPAAQFVVEIKRLPEAGSPQTAPASFQTVMPELKWAVPGPGRYEWRVLAINDGETAGKATWQSFSIFPGRPIALTAPKDNENIYFWDHPPKVALSWQSEEDVAKQGFVYRVTVAKDPDLKDSVAQAKTGKPELSFETLHAGQGTWYWKVDLIDENARLFRSSRVQRFYFGLYPLLNAPEPSSPDAGAVLKVVETGEDPRFEWRAAHDAQSYELTISRDGKPVKEIPLKELSQKVAGLPAGRYTWSVRAIDRVGRKGEPSKEREFTVDYGKRLKAPESSDVEVE